MRIDRQEDAGWVAAGSGRTDSDGRIGDVVSEPLSTGIYRMTFESGAYYSSIGVTGFYPEVVITFEVTDQEQLHVPLLLSPFGYSTYRGS